MSLAFGMVVGVVVAVMLFGMKDIQPVFWIAPLAGGWSFVLFWLGVADGVARGAPS